MNRKLANKLFGSLLFMLLLSYSLHLKAEDVVYKCPNAEGKLNFSDRPCADGYRKEGKKWVKVADYEKSHTAETENKSSTQTTIPQQNKRQQSLPINPQSSTPPSAWDEQMQLAKAAFEKQNVVEGEKHYISALEIAKNFEEKDTRYYGTLKAMGDFSYIYLPPTKEVEQLLNEADADRYKNIEEKLKIFQEYQKKQQSILTGAEPFLKQAIEITEQARGAEHPSLLLALQNLGQFYDAQGRYRDAVPVYTRYFSINEKKNLENKKGSDCTNINIKPTGMLIDQTYFFMMNKGAGWAEAFLKYAIQCAENANQADATKLLVPFAYLAQIYRGQGRTAEADEYYQKVQQLQQKDLQPVVNKNPKDIETLWQMGRFAALQKHHEDAEKFYQQALQLSEQIYGTDNVKLIDIINLLADFYTDQQKLEQAESFFKRSLAIAQKNYDPEDERLAEIFFKLGSYYDFAAKRPADAEPMYKNVLAIWEKKYGYNRGNVVDVRKRLINVYNAQGKKAEAEALSKSPANP